MDVVRSSDPSGFLELTRPLVGADEARNNLFLGILGTLASDPTVYPSFRLWAALVDGEPVGAALRTEPYNLVLADALEDRALRSLLTAVRDDVGRIPGIIANAPFAERAEAIWTSMTGDRTATRFAEGVFELTEVTDLARAPGGPRPATREDEELLFRWLRHFTAEALAHRPPEGDERIRREIDARLTSDDAALWLWERDGETVSLAGYGGATPTGIRIGPVYTPPEERGNGFATTLVADLSRWLIEERAYRSCFLYTDLSNPRSNAIYERVGYRRVANALEIRFEPR
jgi:RimJ/RimL family protein N-acetyltransferase